MRDSKRTHIFDEEKAITSLWKIANTGISPYKFSKDSEAFLRKFIQNAAERIKIQEFGSQEAQVNFQKIIQHIKQKASEEKIDIIDLETLNLCLKEICPCWPFC